ncbi:unnamed protein product [Hymenolepis diminuta]|uniref:DUF3421 domain-containing protein n=1 Tax=Hymenolepis diminuta TaxID=6216 RepID=A0A564YTD8_HYMDI|nr:unnamed protein product [Hymenolepis diminuta]
MPVGCFPSFRKKIKKFHKDTAPLPKKEEANDDASQNNIKPTESNNHVEAKSDSPVKVEDLHVQETVPDLKPETEQSCQKDVSSNSPEVSHKNFEKVNGHAENEVHSEEEIMVENLELEESVVPHEHEPACQTVPQSEVLPEHNELHESELPHVNEVLCESVPHPETAMESAEIHESSVSMEHTQEKEADMLQETDQHVYTEEEKPHEEYHEHEQQINSTIFEPEYTHIVENQFHEYHEEKQQEYQEYESEFTHAEESQPQEHHEQQCESTVLEPEHSHAEETKSIENEETEIEQEGCLPRGFHWKLVSIPVPEGAIDIHELHLPIHVGLVGTCYGEIPCKYLENNRSFYAGIEGREEDFAYGKILCLDRRVWGKIECEWVHVSTPDIRSRNLVAGALDANGRPMYIARGMIPLTGPYPYYELSCGWVSENLEEASLAFGGVEWKQRDFDVLAWKRIC